MKAENMFCEIKLVSSFESSFILSTFFDGCIIIYNYNLWFTRIKVYSRLVSTTLLRARLYIHFINIVKYVRYVLKIFQFQFFIDTEACDGSHKIYT